MNITKQVIDDVNIVLTLNIEKADYAEAVEKAIKETRKRVNMPGFRKGMVPVGMVRRMYGTQITVDEVNRLINDSLYNYIRENKINVLGEPMTQDGQKPFDENVEQYTINFDIAVAPEFTVNVSDKVKVPYYTIKVDDKMIDGQVEGYRNQYGSYDSADVVSEDDVLKGNIAELDAKGDILEGGIVAENTTIYPRYFKSDDEKKLFVGAKKLSSVDFNPAAASADNENEIASMLQIDKDKVKDIVVGTKFRFTILEITHHTQAELNEELFKKAFGDECTTEADFRQRISDQIAAQLKDNSEYKFSIDAREALKKQVGTLKFPEERLKKWLLAKDENRNAEQLDKDFPRMMEDLTWQLIEEKIVADQKIEVSADDIKQEAHNMVASQMMQYGMSNLPMEYMEKYVESVLKDEKQRAQLRDSAVTRKILAYIRQTVKLDEKQVSFEEFNKLLA